MFQTKYDKFLIKAEVVLWAKNEKEARELWEEQLSYTERGDDSLDDTNVSQWDERSKIKSIHKLIPRGKKWVISKEQS